MSFSWHWERGAGGVRRGKNRTHVLGFTFTLLSAQTSSGSVIYTPAAWRAVTGNCTSCRGRRDSTDERIHQTDCYSHAAITHEGQAVGGALNEGKPWGGEEGVGIGEGWKTCGEEAGSLRLAGGSPR